MLKTIRKFYPDAKISILSATPNEDQEYYYYKYGAKTYSRLFNTVNKKDPKIIVGLTFLLKMLLYIGWTRFGSIPLWKHDKSILNLYRSADLIITCGGAYFGGKKYSSIIINLFPMYLSKKLGKKVYVYAQSIEPFTSKIVKIITKFVFNRVDLITAREEVSFNVLKDINVKTQTILTADPAFLLDEEPTENAHTLLKKEGIIINEDLRIGITVRDWNFPTSINPHMQRIQYITAVALALEKILEEKKCIVVFFPQVIFSHIKDDDRIVATEIKFKMKESVRNRVFVLTENYSPEQIKAMIGTMNIFIGTRMHSNIFSISMGVPTLAIAYEYKTYGIMKMLGLEEYILDITNITHDMLIDSVYKVQRDSERIIQKIKESFPFVQREALRNGEFIKDLLKM
jgi:colanic acid/amylovoran biosynthesis protein